MVTTEQANINTDTAISKIRRDAILSIVLRVVLALSAGAGVILNSMGHESQGSILIMLVLASMFLIGGKNAKIHRKIAGVGLLIDTGRYDEAENLLAEVMQSILIYKGPRLGILQNLAALRHAQRRYREAGRLAAEVLKYISPQSSHRRTLNLMLADCALETNDLPTVHHALSQIAPNLPVRESLKLMELQISYYLRAGSYAAAIDQLPMKVELAELMPAEPAAHVQAMLALAAQKMNQPHWSHWLKQRAMLLADTNKLITRTPMLRELGL